ncbi:MAG: hypothetical protein RIM99_02235 [Cyclobacteriaceae bacterium]
MKNVLLLLLLILPMSSSSQIYQADDVIIKLHKHIQNFPQEKAYLHFDKPYYGLADRIWFKAYQVNAYTSTSKPLSRLLRVELIDPQKNIIAHRNLRTENGGANGDFFLSDTLMPGNYTVRAYTNWMRNFPEEFFFQKSFEVYSPESERKEQIFKQNSLQKIALSFFPEGGNLVEGLNSIVAFKAVDENGLGVKIDGEIIDNLGNAVSLFDSNKFGMGIFPLTPKEGNSYYARIRVNEQSEEIPLPDIKTSGLTLKVMHGFRKEIVTFIASSREINMQGSFILLHKDGKVISKIENFGRKSFFSGTFLKSDLPEGILRFTLFDRQFRPHAERILMVKLPRENESIRISVPEETQGTRELAEIRLNLEDTAGRAVSGKVSVSITPTDIVQYPEHDQNIKNYLLMSSELKGHVEQPEYYFSKSEDAYQGLDILLLAQGWRRFMWGQVMNEDFESTFLPETGLSLSGEMLSVSNDKKPVTGVVTAVLMNGRFSYFEGETTDDGGFTFNDLDYEGEMEIALEAKRRTKTGKYRNDVLIRIKEQTQPKVDFLPPSFKNTNVTNFKDEQKKIATIAKAFDFDEDAYLLDEVEITSIRKKDPFKHALYTAPTYRLNVDSQVVAGGNVFNLMTRIPRVTLKSARGGGYEILIRNRNKFVVPRIIYDGRIVDSDFVSTLSADQIQYIDVLLGTQAIAYGALNAIVIYRKKEFVAPEQQSDAVTITQTGYYQAKEFYTPIYDVAKDEHSKPDIRSTLHWESDVLIDNNGEALIHFYTSDQKGIFDIRVEGISQTGSPLYSRGTLNVE